jgi:hypothetical protein
MRFSLFINLSALALLSACSLKPGGSSSLTLKFPSASELSAKSGAAAQKLNSANIDWSKACFMVNVTGSGIDSPVKNKCDVPSGAFGGSVKPSGSLQLDVAKGASRKIEVFAYFRASSVADCPKHNTLNKFDPGSVASVGSSTVDITQDSQVVDVSVSLPGANDSLISEFNLPSFCSATSVALGEGTSRILTARAFGTTANFKVDSVVTGLPTGPKVVTTSGIIVRFSHEEKDKDTQ